MKKLKKNKKESQLFSLLCDLEDDLYKEEDAGEFVSKKLEKLYNRVEELLNRWEQVFRGDKGGGNEKNYS